MAMCACVGGDFFLRGRQHFKNLFFNSSFAPFNFNSAEALSNVPWIGLIQVNLDEGGPSPYIFKKGDMNLSRTAPRKPGPSGRGRRAQPGQTQRFNRLDKV